MLKFSSERLNCASWTRKRLTVVLLLIDFTDFLYCQWYRVLYIHMFVIKYFLYWYKFQSQLNVQTCSLINVLSFYLLNASLILFNFLIIVTKFILNSFNDFNGYLNIILAKIKKCSQWLRPGLFFVTVSQLLAKSPEGHISVWRP